MTQQELLREGTAALRAAHVPEPELDARYLLLEAFHMDLAHLLAAQHRELLTDEETAGKCSRFRRLVGLRAERIPLQHLTGVQEFMGFEFHVNEAVLIPRQDTETLVELVLEEQKDKDICLLDVCTGSGCIAISLALMGGYREVAGLDISEAALLVAEENAGRLLAGHDGRFSLVRSDMFANVGREEQFDVIVSNPPYIPTSVIEGLEPEVRDHEPRLALDGTEDGLKFYRILAEKGSCHLKPGGSIYMEIGFDQAEAVEAMFAGYGFEDVATIKDLAGLDRVVRATWND